MKNCALMVILGMLWGCAATEPVVVAPAYPNLNDQLFPSYVLFEPETPKEIFALSEDAKAFVDKAIMPYTDDMKRMKALVNHIFDRSEMGLLYQGSANSTATQTFDSQLANCLSLSVMTFAMAEYAGYRAQFYDVEIPEYWTRRDGYSLLNGHVNLKIRQVQQPNVFLGTEAHLDVDFDAQEVRDYFPRIPISRERVLAMYYNNKGADAILANSYSKAYSYFRAGALIDPSFSELWVNLGVLYRVNGANRDAESAYNRAIEVNPGNRTAWENLAVLYRREGNSEEADVILARINRERESNPFYHFILGEQALEEGDVKQALTHYRHALQRDRNRHEVMFGLGKAYFELGDISKAKHYLEMAEKKAASLQDQERYRGKLAILQSSNM